MDSPEISSDQSSVSNLRAEVDSLRFMLSFAVLLMFVFNMCVYVYLSRQANIMKGTANETQAMVNAYEATGKNQAIAFWNELNDYAGKHPDFMPIMTKYRSVINVKSAPAPAKK